MMNYNYDDPMIVEELRFVVQSHVLQQFLERDHEVWTTFLRSCYGFIDKQVWTNETNGVVVMQIWWESRSAWKAVDSATVTRGEALMGDMSHAPTCVEYEVWAPVQR